MNWPPRTTWLAGRDGVDGASATHGRLPANELELTELILPEQADHDGTLFGPNGMAMLGKAAFLVASRCTRQSVVMAAARDIQFVAPVPVGALLRLHARVTRVGHRSLSVQVAARLDTAPGIHPEDVLSGQFEMVTVDETGRPCAVQPPEAADRLPWTAPAAR